MSRDVILYRLFRNRRVIIFGAVPPIMMVYLASLITGQSHPVLLTLAIMIPALHAIRYPNMVIETLNVSLTAAICLALAAMNPSQMGIADLLFRTFWLLVMAIVVFMVLNFVTPIWQSAGPKRKSTLRAISTSKLDSETLRKAITDYPGRQDARVTCGKADANGIFDVETRVLFEAPNFGACDLDDEDDEDLDEHERAMQHDLSEGFIRSHTKAMVYESSAHVHEVFHIDGTTEEVIATRHEFQTLKSGGTRVIYQESGAKLPLAMRMSLWLTDYVADHLTDEIDRAEGRRPRANRAFPSRQLIMDIAGALLPRLGGDGLKRPDGDAF